MKPNTCSIRYEIDGINLTIVITNTITMKEDRYLITPDEQGSTYTMLLSKLTPERPVGLFSIRELVENIGDGVL
jgi:hypothetical protein